MPGTLEARRLTEAHRRAQVANERSFLSEFLAAWGLLDLANLDLSTPSWLRVVMRIIEVFRDNSANLARDYVREHRGLELPDTSIELPELVFDSGAGPQVTLDLPRRATRVPRPTPGRPRSPIPLRPDPTRGALVINWRDRDPQVEASLRVTGPQTVKYRIGKGEPQRQAAQNASVEAAGAAMRHVGNGGRDTVLTLVENDRAALGWIRVTSGNPCSFCAMLASRGITYNRYRQTSFGASDIKFKDDPRFDLGGRQSAKVHDNCHCVICPVFVANDPQLEAGKAFRDLWNAQIRNKYSGKDALKAFRRAYEAQQREAEKRKAA